MEHLHKVWVCMDTYMENGGGFSFDGALYDFEDEGEIVTGNIVSQYFEKKSYEVNGKYVIIDALFGRSMLMEIEQNLTGYSLRSVLKATQEEDEKNFYWYQVEFE